jgi:short subunit dehydrogenase-like uncharacterized protein
MSGGVLLYGATGYTGREVARRLAAEGAPVRLAGRDAARVSAVADRLGLPWTAFGLSDTEALQGVVDAAEVVLNAAGPFADTCTPVLDACLHAGVSYLDLNGEWPGFLEAQRRDAEARAAGAMVMPGVGLTICATDCLMALAKARYPDTIKLRVGVSRPDIVTRGTVVSAARLLSAHALVRRGGKVVAVPAGSLTHAFDFGEGLKEAAAMSWADVVTGEHTTGVGDIEVYSEVGWAQRLSYRASGIAMEFTGARAWRSASQAAAKLWPEGPRAEARRRAGFTMVAEAIDPWRRVRRLRIRTLDGYTVSVITAAAAVTRVLAGAVAPGFQTPARVFGDDFVLTLGCAELEQTSQEAVA